MKFSDGRVLKSVEEIQNGHEFEIYIELLKAEEEKYEDEEFDEYQENLIDSVKLEDIKPIILELRAKLQIKKVKKEKAFKYLVKGIIDKKGKKAKTISLKSLLQ